MAKKLREEYIKLNIDINGNKAQKEIYDIEKSTKSLKERQKELRTELTAARKAFGSNSKEVKELISEYNRNSDAIKKNVLRVKELEGGLKVTEMTTKQLRRRAMELRLALSNMVQGGEARKKLELELQQVNRQLGVMNGRIQQQRFSISGAANWLNKYQTMIASISVAVMGVVLSFQQWMQYSAKLSDQQADVMKTTGMTKDEVDALTESISKLNTRTSRIDLLKIAEQGGRIGIAKEEMAGFVEVMDKANVALGDSFTGGPEEIADMLGKIKGLFQETKELEVGPAFEAIGSGLNVVAAQGAASEKNVAEFMQRIGAMPDVLRPAIGDAMGLAAAMEESNIQAEVGSRAYSIFLKQASDKLSEFAKVMGISTEEAKKMFDADPLQFFLEFSKRLNQSTTSATDMANTMAKLGLNADGVNKIVGAAGANFNRYQKLIKISNQAMQEATSLTEEFNTKNENLAAMLQKLQRWFKGVFTSEGIMNGLEWAVQKFGQLVGVLDENDESVQRWKRQLFLTVKILAVLIASVASYRASLALATLLQNNDTKAISLNTIAKKANAATGGMLTLVYRGLVALYYSSISLITRNTQATIMATVAQKGFNTALRANPLGLILSLLTLVAGAIWAFGSSLDRATQQQKKLNTAQEVGVEHAKELSKQTSELKGKIDPLIKVIKDETTSLQVRKRAYEELIKIAPEFTDTLDAEYKATIKLGAAYDDLMKKLDAAALARARASIREKRALAVAEAEADEYDKKLAADAEKEANQKRQEKYSDLAMEQIRTGTKESSGVLSARMAIKEETSAKEAYEEAKRKSIEARKAQNDWSQYQADSIAELEKKIIQRKNSGIASAKEIAALEAELNSLLGLASSGGDNFEEILNPGSTTASGDQSKSSKSSKSQKSNQELERIKQDIAKFNQEILQMRWELEEAEIQIQEDGFHKERELAQLAHNRKLEELKSQLISENELMAMEMAKNKAAKSGDAELAQAIDRKIELAKAKNIELDSIMTQMEWTFYAKMNALAISYGNKSLDENQKQFDRERAQAQAEFNNKLASYKSFEEARQDLSERLSKEELAKIKNWNDAKAAFQKAQNEEEIQRELEHVNELIAQIESAFSTGAFNGVELSLVSEEEKQALLERLEALKVKASELGLEMSNIRNGGTDQENNGLSDVHIEGGLDLFGMDVNRWVQMFDNLDTTEGKLQALSMGVQALGSVWQEMYERQNQKEQQNLRTYEVSQDRKKKALQAQLDQGLINQTQYDQEIAKIDLALEKRKAEIEYNQAKRQKKMALMNVAMQTAQAIMSIWAQVPKFDFGISAGFMTGMVASLGAVKAGIIASQDIPKPTVPGYEEGYGYQDVIRAQDGKPFRAKYQGIAQSGMVNSPSLFLAGEHMPEMIIDGKSFRRFHPGVKEAIHAEIRRVNGYQGGYYPSMTENRGEALDTGRLDSLIALLIENNQLLEMIKEKELVFPRTMQTAKALRDDIKEFEKHRKAAQK